MLASSSFKTWAASLNQFGGRNAGFTMWKPLRFQWIDPIAASAGAAVLCSVLTQHLSSSQAELSSEVLCWAILPILVTVAKRSTTGINDLPRPLSQSSAASSGYQPARSRGSWLVAAGVAAACCYRAELGMIRFLVRN